MPKQQPTSLAEAMSLARRRVTREQRKGVTIPWGIQRVLTKAKPYKVKNFYWHHGATFWMNRKGEVMYCIIFSILRRRWVVKDRNHKEVQTTPEVARRLRYNSPPVNNNHRLRKDWSGPDHKDIRNFTPVRGIVF